MSMLLDLLPGGGSKQHFTDAHLEESTINRTLYTFLTLRALPRNFV